MLISSVLDEFNLDNLQNYQGKVFLDIQGYGRDRNDFGQKKLWEPNDNIFANIFCLKGTKEELKNIPSKYIQKQKKKILIITNGEYGSEIFSFGKHYLIKPLSIIVCKNTIGAGDTFMANFVIRFLRTTNVLDSAKYATSKTSIFLKSKIYIMKAISSRKRLVVVKGA